MKTHTNFFLFSVNRRLDEWVSQDRIDLSSRRHKEELHRGGILSAVTIDSTADEDKRKLTRNQKRRHDEINHVQQVSFF